MTTNVVTLANTPTRTVVKVIADSVASTEVYTISLASLVAAPQTVNGTPMVNIIGVVTSLSPTTTLNVKRNGVIVAKYYANNDIQYVKDCAFVLGEQATFDIVLEFVGGDGMAILELRKNAGYTFGPDLANIAV